MARRRCSFAEFEVDLLRMRTREGMAVARAKGTLRGKQPKLSAKAAASWRGWPPLATTRSPTLPSCSPSPAHNGGKASVSHVAGYRRRCPAPGRQEKKGRLTYLTGRSILLTAWSIRGMLLNRPGCGRWPPPSPPYVVIALGTVVALGIMSAAAPHLATRQAWVHAVIVAVFAVILPAAAEQAGGGRHRGAPRGRAHLFRDVVPCERDRSAASRPFPAVDAGRDDRHRRAHGRGDTAGDPGTSREPARLGTCLTGETAP